jgi:hypothetical protein
MTPADELQFWREMARVAHLNADSHGLYGLAALLVNRGVPGLFVSANKFADVVYAAQIKEQTPRSGNERRAFIARQIARLEREIGAEK